MMMLTAANKKAIPPLHSTEKVDTAEKVFPVKFFQPWGAWTWYVAEGMQQEDGEDGDWLFFGYVEGCENEWGYFTLSELTSVRGPFGLKIERDMHWNPSTQFKDLKVHV